ncbi:MAG TPA: hypothetical protein VLW65_17845 [Bryobacteraceae bacterium]|nr:hypothetical protein [Bryobacteraceae bacterium]
MKTAWLPILSTVAMAFASLPAAAQMVVSAKSGVVNFTEGSVLLNGQAVESTITKYPDIKENSVLQTQAGRAEVLLTPGTIMRVGENSSMKMVTNRLIDTRVELQNGAAVVEAVQAAKDNNVTVVVKNGAVALSKAGVYRFDTEPARLKVFHGEASVEMNGQTIPVSTGRMLMLDGSNSSVEKFNADDTDALDHWGKQRGQLLAMANPSTARSLMSGGYGGFGYAGYGMGGLGYGGMYSGMGCNPYWGFNNWYGMYTYVPCTGYFQSPYGFFFWSPRMVNRFYYNPYAFYGGGGLGRYGMPSSPGSAVRSTSGNYTRMGQAARMGMGSSSPSMGRSVGTGMGSGGSMSGSNGGGSFGGRGGGGTAGTGSAGAHAGGGASGGHGGGGR